jgi:hypothetical protein
MPRSIASLLVAVTLAVVACARREAPAPPAPRRVSNAQIGVAIAALPEGFAVASNSGGTIILRRSAADDPARLTIEAGLLQPQGVDLVEWVEAQPAEFKAKPEGTFLGSKKLSTPIGTAFTARGRYRGELGGVEETRVLAVDPSAPRLLIARYVYATGDDTAARAQQLLDVFAQIERLSGPGTPPAETPVAQAQ